MVKKSRRRISQNITISPSLIAKYEYYVGLVSEHNFYVGKTDSKAIAVKDVLDLMTVNGEPKFRVEQDYEKLPIPGFMEFSELNQEEREGYIIDIEEKLRGISIREKKISGKWQRTTVKAKKIMTTDALTGLSNKTNFVSSLEDAIQNEEEKHAIKDKEQRRRLITQTIGVILFDIDTFKLFNDTYGHQYGDAVLQYVSRKFKTTLRSSDESCRYGGEEFTGLARSITPSTLQHVVAEKVRKSIESMRIPEGEKLPENLRYQIITGKLPSQVTISLGCSIYTPGMTAEQMINLADKSMYESKRRGRNRVIAAWEIGLQELPEYLK